jgi:hypothetical protein
MCKYISYLPVVYCTLVQGFHFFEKPDKICKINQLWQLLDNVKSSPKYQQELTRKKTPKKLDDADEGRTENRIAEVKKLEKVINQLKLFAPRTC